MTEKLLCLKHCNLFQRLSPDQLRRIDSRSRSRSFLAHSPIYVPEQKADSVFLLVSGLVKVCHLTADGKELILAFVEPGELFGELAIFDGPVRDECVKAVDPSTVVMIPADEIQCLISEQAEVSLEITNMVWLRRHRIERRLRNLLFQSNRDRLIHLLLDLAEQFGCEEDDGIFLRVKLSHQDLASLIGSTRETVTVVLNKLKSEGSVEGGRRRIVLTKPDRLANCVHRPSPRAHRPSPRLLPAPVIGERRYA